MKIFVNILWLFVLSGIGGSSFAGPKPPPPKVDIDFDRERFVAGEPFEIEISVQTEGRSEPDIQIPRFKGLEVIQQFQTRPSSGISFSMSFGTGKQTQRIVRNSGTTKYSFVVLASDEGTYTIGPVRVNLDGYEFKSNSRTIKVLPSSAAATVSPDATDETAISTSGSDSQVLKNVKLDSEYFLHMAPSKEEVSLGELIVLDVYLYTSRTNIQVDQFIREPGAEGFWVERFEDFNVRKRNTEQVVIGGRVYARYQLSKLALFPVKSGDLTIAPPLVSLVVGGGIFSMGKQVKRAAEPVTIKVHPLSSENQPDGFNPSNVGDFRFSATVDNRNVKVGEPVTLTLSVKGQGNVRNIVLPTVEPIDNVKMYAPESQVTVNTRRNMVKGQSTSKVLMIPTAKGTFTIPAISWSYFDVSKGQYFSQTSKPITVNVAAGKQSSAQPETGGDTVQSSSVNTAPLKRMNGKMRTIVTNSNVIRTRTKIVSQPWFLILVFLVPAGYFGCILFIRFRMKMADNYEKGRSKRADGIAIKKLRELEKASSSYSNDEFFARLQKIVMGFWEMRLEAPVAGDTMGQLAERLKDRGVDEELSAKVISQLEAYEFARFAKTSGGTGERASELGQAVSLINQCAKVRVTSLEDSANG